MEELLIGMAIDGLSNGASIIVKRGICHAVISIYIDFY